METVVYLIRHSEATPKSNLKNISIHDSKQIINEKNFLSVSGEKRAEELSKQEELQNIDAVYSSNYVRSLETAKYIALENNTIINVDDRLNERKIGDMGDMEWREFYRLQMKDFDFKLSGGESLNQTKKRMVEAMKNILMFETGNRVAVISHSTALTCLLSAWCEMGKNYNDEIILSYNGESIIDGSFTAPMVFKVVFDGMNVLSVEYLELI
ncbi:MAG TPA: histidine phosphatase family protein [Candidatus Coprovivens excrementavium]|nr:histidine phosphatase family protein [Candidatus Coprovivens excrementavium]